MTSCGGDSDKSRTEKPQNKDLTYQDTLEAQIDSLDIHSEYDIKTVDRKDQKEFIENLAKIEKKYGEQWDFCTCVVKNDSINKAIADASDAEIDKLWNRLEAIEKKCQAFLIQSPKQTPEERLLYNKKVQDCLKAAGVK